MNVVKIVDKNFKIIQTLGPDHKNIIDIAQPSVRLKRGIFQSVFFEKTKKKVGIRGSHFSTHGGAVDLEIVLIIKGEIIHGENHAILGGGGVLPEKLGRGVRPAS